MRLRGPRLESKAPLAAQVIVSRTGQSLDTSPQEKQAKAVTDVLIACDGLGRLAKRVMNMGDNRYVGFGEGYFGAGRMVCTSCKGRESP